MTFLEEKGIVERHFGSAVLKRPSNELAIFDDKKNIHQPEKEKIARRALSFIQDDTTVFMNSGTTILTLLKQISDCSINIVTNNILAYEYSNQVNGNLIYTGGTYSDTTRSCIGDFAINIIDQIYGDTCILGVNGISADSAITTSLLPETVINAKMIERCNGKVIILADSSKIGKTYSFTSAKMDKVDILITSSLANKQALDKIRDMNVEVIEVNMDN